MQALKNINLFIFCVSVNERMSDKIRVCKYNILDTACLSEKNKRIQLYK